MKVKRKEKRVVLLSWKQKQGHPVEVFSNLKNLCLSYPQYNYNTLNNYLSKDKTAYENEQVKIERKIVYSRPIPILLTNDRSIIPIVVKRQLENIDEKQHDLEYWLQRPAKERLSAVTFIVAQSLGRGQQMNKSIVHKRKLKYDIG